MKITAIKTPIFKEREDLIAFIKANVLAVPEKSVLVVTSKIHWLCSG